MYTIKTRNLSVRNFAITLFAFLLLIFAGCSKSKDETENPEHLFDKSKFKVVLKEVVNNDNRLSISYEITNTSNENYAYNENGHFAIKFKVKTTDGAIFEAMDFIDDVSAGSTYVGSNSIEYSTGKKVDKASLTYEVYNDH